MDKNEKLYTGNFLFIFPLAYSITNNTHYQVCELYDLHVHLL